MKSKKLVYLNIMMALLIILIQPINVLASELSLPSVNTYYNYPVTLNITASNDIEKIMAKKDGTDFVDITSSKQFTIDTNTTVYLVGYSQNGDEYYYQHTYNIFDYTVPTINASADSSNIYITASDNIGIDYININGSTYSSSELSFNLDEFNTDTISVTAYDYAGNASEIRSLTNQKYLDRIAKEKADKERAEAEKAQKEKERKALEQELEKKKAELEKAKKTARVTSGITSPQSNTSINRTNVGSSVSTPSLMSNISNRTVADSRTSNAQVTTTNSSTNNDETKNDPEIEKLEKEIERINKEKDDILKEQEEKNKKRSIFSFVSKDGKEFHVIKPKGGEDDQENVKLLTEVSHEELISIMNEGKEKDNKKDDKNQNKNSELDILRKQAERKEIETEKLKTEEELAKEKAEKEEKDRKQKRNGQIFLYGIVMLITGAVVYYLKVYKKREKDPYEHDEEKEINESEIYGEDHID